MLIALTSLACLSALLLAAGLTWSIQFPNVRLWPPRTPNHWYATMGWTLTLVIFGALLIVCWLDWNRYDIAWVWRWGAGATLLVIAHGLIYWSVRTLGLYATSGGKDQLMTEGPYRFSRNPQYVADIMILWGWAALAASPYAALIAISGTIALALAPFSEELWLAEQYGSSFAAYRNQTRRFL